MTNYCMYILHQTTLLKSSGSSHFLSLRNYGSKSSNEDVLEWTKLEYQGALRKSGNQSTLKYKQKYHREKQTDIELSYCSIQHLAKMSPQS